MALDYYNTWGSWNLTSSTLTTGNIWPQWVQYGTMPTGGMYRQWVTTSANTSTDPWSAWQPRVVPIYEVNHPPVETPEQVLEREREAAARLHAYRQAMVRREKQRAREIVAEKKRAQRLLRSLLTKEQRAEYDRDGRFHLIVGGKTYRVYRGTHGNVRLLEGDRELEGYCVQPGDVPDEDAMAAQILMLQHDPERFMRIANKRAVHLGYYRDHRAVA